MEELIKLRQEDHTSKALVFSTVSLSQITLNQGFTCDGMQSTSFLDLIARQLQLGGFKLYVHSMAGPGANS